MPDITLMQGDCLQRMEEISDRSVDMVLTDVPYQVVNRQSNGIRILDKGKADVGTFDITNFISKLLRVCKGSFYIFCSTEQVSKIRSELVRNKLSTRLMIWEKTNPSPMNGQTIWLSGVECCVYGKKSGATFNEYCKNTVLRYPHERTKFHPTQKPIKMLEYLIAVSSNDGDTVLDPCMGSGSTAIACANTNRNFIGIELDQGYFNITKQRIEQTEGGSNIIVR